MTICQPKAVKRLKKASHRLANVEHVELLLDEVSKRFDQPRVGLDASAYMGKSPNMRLRASVQRIRQQRFERRRPLETEPNVDSYFDPFDRLTDEFVDKARRPFGETVKRLEVALAGRYELFPAELDEEDVRLCDEIGAAENAIIACCKHYCGTWLDQDGRFTSPSLRRRVAAATAQLEALIPALNSHTARLNAFLDSVPPQLLN
jgi:hypothetical protein